MSGDVLLRVIVAVFALINVTALVLVAKGGRSNRVRGGASKFLTYEMLTLGAAVMILPFYWMIITAFKDAKSANAFPPVWTPSRYINKVESPNGGGKIAVIPLGGKVAAGQKMKVVPEEAMTFKTVEKDGVSITRETPDETRIFEIDPKDLETTLVLSLSTKNFQRAWHRPEETSRGQVNFLTYFIVSITTSLIATGGTLLTSALAAFAFARLEFFGKNVVFAAIIATMMVPGQVLLIPNFLILSQLGLLDTYAALTVPWLASVFTIFLMRQFFMTLPEDLWDAARIDGASRFRYLWQIVVPLSKPVFITAAIFDFLNNWNSLLWPLIVTSTPAKRTLMVGLQNFSDDAQTDYHLLMAASCLAIFPVVMVFFFLQRFFIEGIARTGLK
ncbi:hypothetical protein BH09SUM1_BH09SUM1_12830 [soil metagenome]